jgi:uncharacterized damage-inducible protein DinB
MTWTAPEPSSVKGLMTEGPLVGADRPILEAFLRWERATLLGICAGLTPEQLASHPLASSNLTLLGLVRHMAKVERVWLRIRAAGEPVPPMYDPALGHDHDFDDLDPALAEQDFRRLQDEWVLCDAAVADLPFDHTFDNRGETMSLRMTYVHLIGEYARHNGHGDLLREAIDGVTGR